MHIPNRDASDEFYEVEKTRRIKDGRRVRPRCPGCDFALSQRQDRCGGCNASIVWINT